MTRGVIAALVAAAILAAAACASAIVAGPGLAAPTTGSARSIARVQVTAREYSLSLSRPVLRAGLAIVELYNLGEDDHDLALRRVGPGAVTRRIPIARPRTARSVELRLRAGRYRLWCTLLDHRARGMHAVVVVR